MLSCAPRIPIFLDSSELLLLRGFLGNLTTPNVPPDSPPHSISIYTAAGGDAHAARLPNGRSVHTHKNQSPSFSIFIYRRLAETNLFFCSIKRRGLPGEKKLAGAAVNLVDGRCQKGTAALSFRLAASEFSSFFKSFSSINVREANREKKWRPSDKREYFN